LITFSKVIREQDVNCDEIGLLLPGDGRLGAYDHPLYASLLSRPETFGDLALAFRGAGRISLPQTPAVEIPVTAGLPAPEVSSATAKLDRVLAVARSSSSPGDLMAELGWSEREYVGADHLFRAVRATPALTAGRALELGLVRPTLLQATRV
jgi:hypothetical protein